MKTLFKVIVELQEFQVRKMVKAICMDCKGIAYVGGAQIYQCMFKNESLEPKVVAERIEIECDKFELAPRGIRVKMKEYVEVGITKIYGGGSIQLPAEIRKDWGLKDGDKILWIREAKQKYSFRKVGHKPPFKPHYI